MKKYAILIQDAIKAAKTQDWDKAVELNTEILERNSDDIGAKNRMGLAYMQLGKTTNARKAFNSVLEKDKSNIIAKKHLTNLKNKKTTNLSVSQVYFIEEPGKTKIAELHRLARKDFLNKLQVGQKCQLVSKGKHISIETDDGKYVGSLPDDLSFRLCKLIANGNEYECLIHSFNKKKCRVHLREGKTSLKNKHTLSFPSGKIVIPKNSHVEEELLIEDAIPVASAESKSAASKTSDFENTLEKINKGEVV